MSMRRYVARKALVALFTLLFVLAVNFFCSAILRPIG